MAQPLPNPIKDFHEQSGAEFQPYADLEIVGTFGEPESEYAAIRKGCGLMDLPQRGVLQLTGADRLPFLNNLLTNQTWDKQAKAGLAAGKGVYAFFLNNKGRVAADMNVLERGEITLLETDARMAETVRAAFDRYIFVEKVKLQSRVGDLHELALLGPKAKEILDEALQTPVAELGVLESAAGRVFDTDVTVWRDDPCGVPGYHLLFDAAAGRQVWTGFMDRFGRPNDRSRRRLRPVGWAAFNATRVEAGRPLFDIDFGNSADPERSVLPAETGELARAVSFTKGCYLGQEIVARMHARGQVAKQLVGLRLADDSLPIAGSPIFDEQSSTIGAVTSSTVSPVLSNAAICLGYVKRPLFAEGTVVQVPAEGSLRKATVVKRPFI
jgi:aminomethyltransferase